MNITVLLVVAYLTNGAPITAYFVLPGDHPCDAQVASDYVRRFVIPGLPEGASIQDPDATGLHICAPVPPGTPGPAMKLEPLADKDDA